MYRSGDLTGEIGPMDFILKILRRNKCYTDKWLRKQGWAEVSTIVMTLNAFMTIESWEEITPCMFKGL